MQDFACSLNMMRECGVAKNTWKFERRHPASNYAFDHDGFVLLVVGWVKIIKVSVILWIHFTSFINRRNIV